MVEVAPDIRKIPQKLLRLKLLVSLVVKLFVEHSFDGVNQRFSNDVIFPSSDSFRIASEKSLAMGEPF